MTIRGLLFLQASLISTRQLHVMSISKTYIKPASPTPLNLNKYELPLHDRMFASSYIPLIFFYPNLQSSNKTRISDLLKNSLSKTLSMYYPFAGRLSSSGSYVECNDQGVQFLEAQIGCKLSDTLENVPDKDEEKGFGRLFAPGSIWGTVFDSCLMFVQLNHFSCGGLAIAVSLSHRVADGCTYLSFVRYWASVSCNSTDHEELVHLRPCFVHDLLPQSSNDDLGATQVSYPEKHWITKEIVIYNSKITELKADHEKQNKIHGDQNYTRNEFLTALLYRSAVAANATSNYGAYPKSVLFQAINMRPLIDPPLPKTSVGNLITFSDIPTNTITETNLDSLLCHMRERKMQLTGLKSLAGKEFIPLMDKYAKINQKIYLISSICNFPLYDEMDFGWGRPVKATIVDAPCVNSIFLMDTPRKDGVKAVVSMEEQAMKNFLVNIQLLTCASFQ